ncbi:YtpR family tRNA-binding protein [Siminovitchia sp. 179-K 8D1 HS]|uniref:YtpR family tRNA-binding protein n=1 Tax=Siminovitchia sp. 179-K 8D1 HS TaxID=3142385 RepID=UPI0039A3C8C1
MNVFYNREGIGDTLIIVLKELDRENLTFERKGDAVRIFDKETNTTGGFNLFHASKYIAIDAKGNVELSGQLVEKIGRALAENGIEEKLEADLSPKFVVGFVKHKEKHPNADKLSVCQVDIGSEELQIVCGAPNVQAGQKVVVAKAGAVMPNGMVIKDAELRGIASSGMICSARELGLPNAPEKKGILVLEDDKYETGQAFA